MGIKEKTTIFKNIKLRVKSKDTQLINKTKGALEYIEVSNSKSTIKVALQGAHIFDFQVKGQEKLLFLSETAKFEKAIPIRGGIPICWPWFGVHPKDASLPKHGFARIAIWEYLGSQEQNDEKTKLTFLLKSSKETQALWPYEFELKLEVLMSDILEVSLITRNTGNKTFHLTQALHTYLEINDINTVILEGLKDKNYYNKLDDSYTNIQSKELIFKEETDRIYQSASASLVLHDKKQNIEIKTEGSHSIVVWNPGKDFANNFSDLHDYRNMLCVESANVLDDVVLLEKDETHTLRCVLKQESR